MVHMHHPLPDHPELSVIELPGYREYRLQHPIATKQPKKYLRNLTSSFLMHVLLAPVLALSVQIISENYLYPTIAIILILALRSTLSQLLYESVLLLPPHGIQLETHWGLARFRPIFSKKRFIPAADLQDVIINEGLHGWNVLYYLAVVRSAGAHKTMLEVAYEELLPCHSILLEVLEGIHDIILVGPAKTNVTSPNELDQLP